MTDNGTYSQSQDCNLIQIKSELRRKIMAEHKSLAEYARVLKVSPSFVSSVLSLSSSRKPPKQWLAQWGYSKEVKYSYRKN